MHPNKPNTFLSLNSNQLMCKKCATSKQPNDINGNPMPLNQVIDRARNQLFTTQHDLDSLIAADHVRLQNSRQKGKAMRETEG